MRSVHFSELPKADMDKIVNSFYNQWVRFNPSLDKDLTERKFRQSYCQKSLPYGFALYDGLNLVGFCVLKVHNVDSRHELTPWISDVMVLEPLRRKGYGKAIIDEAIRRLKIHGYKKVYVWTDQASMFYHKLGFTYMGTATKSGVGEVELFYKDI